MSGSIKRIPLPRREATRAGMALAFHAHQAGDRPAVLSPSGDRSFDELNARATQLARALRARGLGAGDVEIRDEEMKTLAPGQVGQIYLRAPEVGRFVYHKDSEKTSRAYDTEGAYFTLGDMGYVDPDGHLFLCDRSADVIISGGVNIYPAEVDAVLLTHPCVGDVAVVGVPNEEWGEEVRAVVELRAGIEPSEVLASELVEYSRERLAHYKSPRRVDFVDALPRHDTGKIYRRSVRERYWTDRGVKI